MVPEVGATHGVRAEGSWATAIRAHVSFATRIYSDAEMRRLSAESGLALQSDGANSATSYEDAVRYLHAVERVCGPTAFIRARLTIMNKARTLGLRAPGGGWFK